MANSGEQILPKNQVRGLPMAREFKRGSINWRGLRWLLIVSGALVVLPTANADEPSDKSDAAPPEIESQENVEYGKAGDVSLKLDLYRPKQQEPDARRPALVFIHGGGWQGGRKEDFGGLAADAARRGYVAVTIDYRLAPQHHFPAAVEDCKCAVRWLRAHADSLGVDPERIGAIGGSAGGHLVMMLGTMNKKEDGLEGNGGWPEQPSNVQVVVSYVGPTDLLADYPPISQRIVERFIGGDRDSMRDAYRRASPVTYVDASDPPMLLFQGTKDPLVPFEQAYLMACALTKAGVPGRVELILGAGHGFAPPEMKRTIDATFAFLDRWRRSK